MSYWRALGVWLLTYAVQCQLAVNNHWHTTSVDYYIFYGVATVMMVISYVAGRYEDIKENDDEN